MTYSLHISLLPIYTSYIHLIQVNMYNNIHTAHASMLHPANGWTRHIYSLHIHLSCLYMHHIHVIYTSYIHLIYTSYIHLIHGAYIYVSLAPAPVYASLLPIYRSYLHHIYIWSRALDYTCIIYISSYMRPTHSLRWTIACNSIYYINLLHQLTVAYYINQFTTSIDWFFTD